MTRQSKSRHRVRVIAVAATFALLSLTCTPATVAAEAHASVNAVVVWDLTAQTAIRDLAQQAQLGTRGFAMVSGAVYDAVNAIAGTPYQPYLTAPRANGTESTDAAVGTAAYRVLDNVFPAQREWLLARYDEWLAGIPDGRAKSGGIRIGDQTAAAMIEARTNDGVAGSRLWSVGDEPGQWRPTPSGFANAGAWVGDLRPFAIPDADDVPHPRTARAQQPHLRPRPQRGQAARFGVEHGPHRGPDRSSTLVARLACRLGHQTRPRRHTAVERPGHRTPVRTGGHRRRGRLSRLRERQGVLALLAPGHRHPPGRHRRQPTHHSRPRLDTTAGNATAARLPVRPHVPHQRTDDRVRYFFGRDRVSFSSFSVDSGTTRHFTSFSQATGK